MSCRLKMEALTDREQALPEPESGDEAPPAEEAPWGPAQRPRADSCSLPLSQSSSSELPASQPQPCSAQAEVDEEDLVIEEYESDGP